MALPPLLPVSAIHERLQRIFPEGCPNRRNCTWEIAAKTVFVMLYIGAVESAGRWLRPDQVTRMTDAQAQCIDEWERQAWTQRSLDRRHEIAGRWYAVNTRESIRDDTIRNGLIANGVCVERQGLATTSPAPRYALKTTFAALFDPGLNGQSLYAAITDWQREHLAPDTRASVTLLRQGIASGGEHTLVRLPNGETRRLAPGPSSIIVKAVIEDFAPRFLHNPGVVCLSESRKKMTLRDHDLAQSIGLRIQPEKHLPDIVLADIGSDSPFLVFVEIIATDGSITRLRKQELTSIASSSGFSETQLLFINAYLDRSRPAFRKTIGSLAWGTFAWFAAEPKHLLYLHEGNAGRMENSPFKVDASDRGIGASLIVNGRRATRDP